PPQRSLTGSSATPSPVLSGATDACVPAPGGARRSHRHRTHRDLTHGPAGLEPAQRAGAMLVPLLLRGRDYILPTAHRAEMSGSNGIKYWRGDTASLCRGGVISGIIVSAEAALTIEIYHAPGKRCVAIIQCPNGGHRNEYPRSESNRHWGPF